MCVSAGRVCSSVRVCKQSVLSGRGQGEDAALAAVVCHTPLSNLGHCRKGSTLSFSVSFQILRPGLYEVRSQVCEASVVHVADVTACLVVFS